MDKWVPTGTKSPLRWWFGRLRRWQQVALVAALVPFWLDALYRKALRGADGDRGQALTVLAVVTAIYAAVVLVALVADRFGTDGDDEQS